MINAVIFDIGQVLVDFCWRDLFAELGFTGEKFDRIAQATVYSKCWVESDRGVMTPEEVVEGFVANAPEYREEIEEMYRNTERLVRPRAYVIPLFRELKARGCRIYILSNMPERIFEVNEKTNFGFLTEADGAVISYKEKMIKPEREIFDLLCRRYQINPAEAVFIDDNEANITAAKAYGLHGILYAEEAQAKEELEKLLEEK